MDYPSSRSQILGLIKSANKKTADNHQDKNYDRADYFSIEPGSEIEIFERSFKKLQGNFLRCKNFEGVADILSQLPSDMLNQNWCCTLPEMAPRLERTGIRLVDDIMLAHVAITDCECLVARTGSVVLSSALRSGRALPVYAPVHITIAKEVQLVYDTDNAIAFLLDKYGEQLPSSLHFVAGPSRTGDIEKTLVMGVHGPKDVFVLLLEE